MTTLLVNESGLKIITHLLLLLLFKKLLCNDHNQNTINENDYYSTIGYSWHILHNNVLLC